MFTSFGALGWGDLCLESPPTFKFINLTHEWDGNRVQGRNREWRDCLWFFHARCCREGENAGLRLMFFRLAKLLSDPILPLFVFDGPKHPAWKRGTQVSKRPHWMVHGMKTMIGAFDFEWWEVRSMTLTLGLDSELRP